ncbi:MAG: hypothetical protein P794_03030 [Epsilonproteobacteria bacterium (ex Lamellibrachia satsuma)]|nr:MAG: hypothetical protein P794_03030 [Epsilonproteobacteria bacterium (ex Lamellibrachia satsuma)]
MANNKEKTYWPHMIMGFLLIGITLGYWTVKSAVSVPVQKSNEYMMKYQQADMNINTILEKKALFDKHYTIELMDAKMFTEKIAYSKVGKERQSVVLAKGKNAFVYNVVQKDGTVISDANVTFLLTRPHTRKDDVYIENIPFVDGQYKVENIDVVKPGRYTLQLRAKIGDAVGYSNISAYLKP